MTAMGEHLRDTTYDRRRLRVLSLLILCFPGLTNAGALAPLRVDPALLGGRAASPAAATAAAGEAVSVKPELSDGETAVRASSIRGLRTVEVVAEGEAEIERGDFKLAANRLTYNELTDEVVAEGDVVLQRGEDRLESTRGNLVLYERVGQFESPEYSFVIPSRSDDMPGRTIVGRGKAKSISLEGENQFRAEGATWTTCKPTSEDWFIRAEEIELDFDRQVGTAHGSSLVFMDVPLLYWPRMSFPLAEQRQSGFLVPSVAASNKTGFDVTVPYYWNIAPNYDATIVPRVMSRRGLQLGAEFRYLTPTY
ncbi:MAG: LPS-assembly protein LptD, partial [Azoarcus sp.]|nr:LPS-assembly protein LptD [Azoarcus sp.]